MAAESVFDIARARRETRGCEPLIHFNNAGASLPPAPVADALYSYLLEEELQGGYEVMARRAAELEYFYAAAARLLNCSADEIAFVDSATRAWTAAFYSFNFRPGERILYGRSEYGSNLVALLHQARCSGVELVEVPDDALGRIDVAALESLIDERVRLICLTQVPSGFGLVNPAVAVGRVAKRFGIPYLLDACQALGQLPVDVEAIGCDILCGTGRKFLRGPRGTGLLYVRKTLLETLEPSQLNHHAAELLAPDVYRLRNDARRFEVWERSYAGQLALGIAIEYALGWGLKSISTRICTLAEQLRAGLAEIDGIEPVGCGPAECGIVSFGSCRHEVSHIRLQLAKRGINVSTVPSDANPLSVTAQLFPSLVRASVHYYNTIEELQRLFAVLQELHA